MNGIASKHGFPEDDIIWRYLVEYSLCILYAHTFSIHVHDTIMNPFIRLQTNSNDLFMSVSAFLSAATLAHAFRIPTKVTGLGSTPSCCISSYSSNPFCPYPHFTYATNHSTPTNNITSGHLVENPWSILYAPTFCVHVNEVATHIDMWLKAMFSNQSVDMFALFKCL